MAISAVGGSPAYNPPPSKPGTVDHLTLPGGQQVTAIEADPSSLTATPLAIAWAPQLMAQADTDKDSRLDSGEFTRLLQRAGVNADQAEKLFQSFDSSQDGKLTVDEFVDGVTQQVNDNNPLFQKLIDSYTRNPDGSNNESAVNAFLAQGFALASDWASRHPRIQTKA